VASGGTRGPSVICPLVELGDLFEAAERVPYFNRVLEQINRDERSAYAELVLVAALVKSGFPASFEDGKSRPDAVTTVDGTPIAFEVYVPDRAEKSKAQMEFIHEISARLRRAVADCRVEVDVHEDDVGIVSADSFVEAAKAAPASSWVQVGRSSRLRRIDQGEPLLPQFDGDGPTTYVGGQVKRQLGGFYAIVRASVDDGRAREKLEEKRSQLNADIANVVVINVNEVGGISDWPAKLAESLGDDFDKVGAVVFFDQGVGGPPEGIRRRWMVLVNNKAIRAIPEHLLASFERISYRPPGVAPSPRLTAPAEPADATGSNP